jgi:hypothetical protein
VHKWGRAKFFDGNFTANNCALRSAVTHVTGKIGVAPAPGVQNDFIPLLRNSARYDVIRPACSFADYCRE